MKCCRGIRKGLTGNPVLRQIVVEYIYMYYVCIFTNRKKPKNWVGVTMVNVRAVKYTVRLKENVVQNYIEIG